MKAIVSAPIINKCTLKTIGPTTTRIMDILKTAELEAARIIEDAISESSKIRKFAIAELEERKKILEAELADLETKRKVLQLEAALAKQLAKSQAIATVSQPVETIRHPPSFENPPPQLLPDDEGTQLPSKLRVSRILPFINVEKMKAHASTLEPEAREKFVSSTGLNVHAGEFKIG
jgi:cell fate (sporulation/competence/biofilm development) regulator YmcA (YheA/YmcA/DUF963 family)